LRPSPRLLAEARFALARARQSRELAAQAKEDYATLGPAFDKERAEVDAFLK
jgi:hypothetical protein